MGQKVNPIGIRLGVVRDWSSTWYAEKGDFAHFLNQDLQIRDFLRRRLASASISQIRIARPARSVQVTIHTARPGIVIGKRGEDIERLRTELGALVGVPRASMSRKSASRNSTRNWLRKVWRSSSKSVSCSAAP